MTDSKVEETGLTLVASLIGELQKQVLVGVGEIRSLAGRHWAGPVTIAQAAPQP